MTAPKINQLNGTANLSARKGKIEYIVIHYTGGTGSAANNCKYFAGGDRGASADYFIDDKGIWQYNASPSKRYSWAVGDGHGRYGIANANSVSVEVVNDGGAFSEAEIGWLEKLVPYLMGAYGVPASKVVRHWDASRKQCPAHYVDSKRWKSLHARITKGGGAMTGKWVKNSKGWWYEYADGSYPKSRWLKLDAWYWFDASGYAARSCCLKINGKWYAFGSDCRMLTSVKVNANGDLAL